MKNLIKISKLYIIFDNYIENKATYNNLIQILVMNFIK